MENYEFIGSLAVAAVAIAGLIWRFDTRLAGVESRIADLSHRVSRIEGLLERYVLQSGKKEE